MDAYETLLFWWSLYAHDIGDELIKEIIEEIIEEGK